MFREWKTPKTRFFPRKLRTLRTFETTMTFTSTISIHLDVVADPRLFIGFSWSPSRLQPLYTGVSAAADRPARRRGSAHAKYPVSHHMVIKPILLLGLAAEYRSRRWVWSTVVRRPSEVYDTHRRTKVTAPETNSRSRNMVGAHRNLKGSRAVRPRSRQRYRRRQTTPTDDDRCQQAKQYWPIRRASNKFDSSFLPTDTWRVKRCIMTIIIK